MESHHLLRSWLTLLFVAVCCHGQSPFTKTINVTGDLRETNNGIQRYGLYPEHRGQRLLCYHCYSETNPVCLNMDPSSPPLIPVLCLTDVGALGRPRCLKEVGTVDGRTIVRRSCVMARLENSDAACEFTASSTVQCSLCDSDACNSATQYKTLPWSLLFSVATAWTVTTVL